MIRIVRGVYGYLDKDGIVRPKTEADAPFELLPEQEARLVRLGVAEYVGATVTKPALKSEDRTPNDYSVKELRELGKSYGLTFKVGISKAEMVQAIEEAEAGVPGEAEDNEPAPVFDATEAIQ